MAELTDALGWRSGFLFGARAGSKTQHLGKDTVGRTIKAVRDEFVAAAGLTGTQNIRSHSGRRRQITEMIRRGVDEKVGMSFSRHTSRAIYNIYADLTPQDRLTHSQRA
jgi:hypothetical protein